MNNKGWMFICKICNQERVRSFKFRIKDKIKVCYKCRYEFLPDYIPEKQIDKYFIIKYAN